MGVRKLFPRVFAKKFFLSGKGMGDIEKNGTSNMGTLLIFPIFPFSIAFFKQ
jgi:hypothetical protein